MRTKLIQAAILAGVAWGTALSGKEPVPENMTEEDLCPTVPYLFKKSDVVCAGIVTAKEKKGKEKIRILRVEFRVSPFEAAVYESKFKVRKVLKGRVPPEITIRYHRTLLDRPILEQMLDGIGSGTRLVFLERDKGGMFTPTREGIFSIAIDPVALKNPKAKTMKQLFMATLAEEDLPAWMVERNLRALSQLLKPKAFRAYAKKLIRGRSKLKRGYAHVFLLENKDISFLAGAISFAKTYRHDHNGYVGYVMDDIGMALNRLTNRKALPHLHKLLKDPASPLFRHALWAVITMADPSSRTALISCLRQHKKLDLEHKYECLTGLARIDNTQGGPSFEKFKEDPDKYIREALAPDEKEK